MTLEPRQFGPAAVAEATRRRGEADEPRDGPPKPKFAVAGRNRVEMRSGMWRKGDNGATITAGDVFDTFGGFEYTRFVREDLAVTFGVEAFAVEFGTSVGDNGVGSGNVGGYALPLGIRWNPFRGDHRTQWLKPFVAVGAGPVIGLSSGSFVGRTTTSAGNATHGTLGGHFGGGFDVHVTRAFSIGIDLGYNLMVNFSETVGLRDNFNGAQVALGVGWVFGKGN